MVIIKFGERINRRVYIRFRIFYRAIITLKESDFYDIKEVEGGFLDIKGQQKKIWDKATALNYIDYGYLNDELFDLFHRDTFRDKIRQLIRVYLRAFDMAK